METGEKRHTVSEVEEQSNNGEEAPAPAAEAVALADFWPHSPSTPCSEALKSKFAKFLKIKKEGKSFNEDLRRRKGYRNPDYLQLAVVYGSIDQIGSCFDPQLFDPHGYDKSDYVDALDKETLPLSSSARYD